jgi:peptidoglycan/xylan/chitin deacetylase (PgdA/CDA1 family)
VTRARWITKKLARHTVAAASRPLARPGVRVLTYHRFGEARGDPYTISAADFEAQMRWLAQRRLALSLEDLERFLDGSGEVRQGVVVTMDDGSRSVLSVALPVLRAHAIPAVVFVPAGLIGSGDTLDWDELTRLRDGGIVIGSHGHLHRSFGRISLDQARDEAERSREELEARLGVGVTSFAYPYGTRADFDVETGRILRQSGYRLAFTSQHAAVDPAMDRMALPRLKVEGGEARWMFRAICTGGLDAWGWVDRFLWRLQRP